MNLFEVKDLNVAFKTPEGIVNAVNNLSFAIKPGETLGIVGESGSGKSQTAFALNGLIAKNGIVTGSALLEGKEILNLPEKEMNRIRAEKIAMIFQDPMTALNPFMKIGKQLMEVLKFHKGMSRQEAYKVSLEIMDAVKIPEAKKRMEAYPYEMSGGMKQRIMIAMALLCKPQLLIADEPTTALDVTVQSQILDLLNELKNEFNTSIIMITHDMGVVAGVCDQVLVMYGGQVMEHGSVNDIFYRPSHPYTTGLLKSIPRLDDNTIELATIPGNPPNLLQLKNNCPFNERCEHVTEQCTLERPILKTMAEHHEVACFWCESQHDISSEDDLSPTAASDSEKTSMEEHI